MKKVVFNFIGFVAFFALTFAIIQPIFVYTSDAGVAVAQMYNEPEHSLDVIMLGACDIRPAVLAPVLWDEAGIASLSLAMNGMKDTPQYYLLKEILRFQSPSVVIVSGNYLFVDTKFDGEDDEARFRQVFDEMRWSRVKFESILDVLSRSETQSLIDYIFPFLRFHSRQNISREDFDFSYKRQRNLYMGTYELSDTHFEEQTLPDFPVVIDEPVVIYGEYLAKIVDLCRENGIEVVIVNAPTCQLDLLNSERRQALRDYADEHGIPLLDLNDPEFFSAIGLDLSRDFYGVEHVNIVGGTKTSIFLAQWLKDTYNFADRREAPYDPHWDDVLELYFERYSELESQFP